MRMLRHLGTWPSTAVLLAVLLGALSGTPAGAQQVSLDKEAYLTPPKEIADAVLATRHENVTLSNLSPDGKKLMWTSTRGGDTSQLFIADFTPPKE